MSEDRAYRISGFPSGVWWVRWLDTVAIASAMPGTPTVQVVLSPLATSSAGTAKLVDVAKNATGCQTVEVAIGLITALAIGMIFEDGRLIGRMAADERAFDFDLPGDFRGQFPANENPNVVPPAWWTAGRDPPPLNWSTLKYVFWQTGGPICRRSATSLKRSDPPPPWSAPLRVDRVRLQI